MTKQHKHKSNRSDRNKTLNHRSNKIPYIIEVFNSNYCKFVFLISLILGYFLIPHDVFFGKFFVLGFIFLINFAIIIACIIRNIKERIKLASSYKNSIISIIATSIGLAALQVCGVNSAVCGATFGLTILTALFPSFIVNLLTKYSLSILIISILIQFISIYFMGCFKRVILFKK